MAKRTTITEVDEAPEKQTPEKTPVTFFEMMKGEGKVHVSRITPEGRRKRIGTYRKEDFENDPDIVPRKFGGGTFYFQIADEHGHFVDNFTFEYDEAAWPMPESPGADMGPGYMPAPSQPETSPIDLMRAMQEHSDKSQERLMMIMNTMFSNIATALGNKQAERSKLEDLKELLSLVKENHKSDSGPDKLIEVIKLGMELGNGSAPAESEGFLGILGKKLVNDGILEKVLTALKGGSNPPIYTPPPPAARQIQSDTEVIPQMPAETVPAIKPEYYDHHAVKMYGPLAVIYAKSNIPTMKVAEQIAAQIPEHSPAEAKTLEILNKADFVDFVSLYQPELKKYPAWVMGVRDDLKAILTAPPEPEGSPAIGGAGPAIGA